MLARTIRSIWSEPSAPDARGPGVRDAVLVALVTVIALIETVLRDGLVWPIPSLLATLVSAFLLPWRRVHPLMTTAAAVGFSSPLHVIAVIQGVDWEGLGTAVVFLLWPYSLGRWASGREAVGGAGAFAMIIVITAFDQPIGDTIGGVVVVSLAVAIGAGVRYRAISGRQQVDSIRSRERAELARELHDSVAHHVSTIAVQAHVGRTFVQTDPAATAEALAVISDQASQCLEEMRVIVSALREGDAAELAPQYGIRDIEALADTNMPGP
ncbi:MAG TPA: histidine kinase dimerization/phosphoacceptor domain-containing protein, partial [Ilumatobacter sp.]|nr:histidine kinase dimerization/phosphoacceptor domain-containing protein [Ilumatobacter sp.]